MKKALFLAIIMVLAIPNLSLATYDDSDNNCDTGSYVAPVVTAEVEGDAIYVSWDEIVNDELDGYKVVISKNDSTPAYPANGYLSWITDTSVTSKLVDNSSAYHSGDFGSYLEEGEDYYFSVTAVYDCDKVAGNVIHLTFPGDEEEEDDLPPYPVCDHNNDGVYNLSDVSLFAACANTFDANGDGVHNLTDVGLYTANYSDQTWCQENVSECSPVPEVDYTDNATTQMTCDHNGDGLYNLTDAALFASCIDTFDADGDGLHNLTDVALYAQNHNDQAWCVANLTECNDIDEDETDECTYDSQMDIDDYQVINITSDSAKVKWHTSAISTDFYRYSTSQSALDDLPWLSTGIENDPDVTGRYGRSHVVLTDLEAATKYYVEVKATAPSYYTGPICGNTKIITFITYGDTADLPVPEVTGVYDRGELGTLIEWEPIDHSMFSGYKIVASKSDSTPVYPENGYYRYITTATNRGLIINNGNAYHSGDFGSYFVPGEEYYFSVTALYNAGRTKVAGNVIKATYVGPEGASTSEVKPTEDSLAQMRTRAQQLLGDNLGDILGELEQLRNRVKEQENEIKYLRNLVSDLSEIAQSVKDVLTQFITYGVDENTEKLGEGERAAVIYSFQSAFGKLPETEDEVADAIKIANGRWPSVTNEAAESRAKAEFKKIYLRDPDMSNPNDNAAVTVMAYGLRQKAENRNLDSEKQGIKTFQYIYGYTPQSTEDWNIMQAITYSGATR